MIRRRIARLFRSTGRKSAREREETAAHDARIELHVKTLKACRRVLERLDGHIVLDVAELPMDKRLIQSTLEEIMRDWRGTEYEKSLRKFYLGLARCQPGVGSEGIRSCRNDPIAGNWREKVLREERELKVRLSRGDAAKIS
ncbi:MAG TPA: hypothetical protein VF267_08310 [Gammaproteobacteria bacterium]